VAVSSVFTKIGLWITVKIGRPDSDEDFSGGNVVIDRHLSWLAIVQHLSVAWTLRMWRTSCRHLYNSMMFRVSITASAQNRLDPENTCYPRTSDSDGNFLALAKYAASLCDRAVRTNNIVSGLRADVNR